MPHDRAWTEAAEQPEGRRTRRRSRAVAAVLVAALAWLLGTGPVLVSPPAAAAGPDRLPTAPPAPPPTPRGPAPGGNPGGTADKDAVAKPPARPAFDTGGLYVYLSFDRDPGGTVRNQSGDGPDGAPHAVKWTREGRPGGALEFDGAASHVDLGAATQLPAWDDYTVSAWFLNDGRGDQGRGYGQKVFDKTIMYHDFYLCVTQNGELLFMTYDTDKGGSIIDKSRDYRDGKWHHAAVVKRGAAGRLYVDGELKGSCETIVKVTVDGPLLLGFSKSPDPYQQKHWSGALDEFAVFRRALSEDEVRALRDGALSTPGLKLPPARPLAPPPTPPRRPDPPDVF